MAINWIAQLYIFWFLHQTTTGILNSNLANRCISFDSYIKPQPISSSSSFSSVVYLLIPTSNHNATGLGDWGSRLYIFWFLHQTTTLRWIEAIAIKLYIFWFLHQTTTDNILLDSYEELYIFWFLHQTTTGKVYKRIGICCISFDPYIKPQL